MQIKYSKILKIVNKHVTQSNFIIKVRLQFDLSLKVKFYLENSLYKSLHSYY